MSFAELGICPEILEAIEVLGFETPSPIQQQAIPAALEGKDIVGLSHTGSGKTLAFSIPALENIDPAVRGLRKLSPERSQTQQPVKNHHYKDMDKQYASHTKLLRSQHRSKDKSKVHISYFLLFLPHSALEFWNT